MERKTRRSRQAVSEGRVARAAGRPRVTNPYVSILRRAGDDLVVDRLRCSWWSGWDQADDELTARSGRNVPAASECARAS